MKALIDVHHRPGHAARQGARNEGRKIGHLFLRKALLNRRMLLVVFDVVAHDARGVGRAGQERSCGNGVDAQAVLSSELVRKITGIGFKRRLGRRHASAVAMNHLNGRQIAQTQNRAAFVHHRAKSMTEARQRVSAHAERSQVALPARVDQIEMHFRTVGQGVHQNIQRAVPEVALPTVRQTLNGKITAARVALARPHVFRNVLHDVIGGVERINLLELEHIRLSEMPGGELSIFIEFTPLEHLLEDPHRRRPGGDADRGSALVKGLCNRKSKPACVRDAGNQCSFST